jgi:hypothetical protein
MHRAALNVLKMVATSYQQKKRRHITRRKHTRQDHLAVTIVLGAEAVVDDLERHHQNSMGVQSMEELEDLDLQTEGTAMKTTKRRWEHHALPIGFALSTSSTNIGRNQRNSYAEFVTKPHWRNKVMVEQIRERNYWKLGKSHEAIYK